MKIKSVEFIGAIGQLGQAAPVDAGGLPQVAFSGRSNVGKSSLINRLLGRTRTPVARVSREPGKTQEINFYRVGSDLGEFCLVDLPGYGFAKVPHTVREKWRPLMNRYLTSSEELRGVVQLVDMRHGPTADDLQAIDYLAELGLPALVVLTKSDKLRAAERQRALGEITERLGVDLDQVIPVSAKTGDGVEELLDTVAGLMAG
ncbi:MAG TPA: ribosome biogenesis GTP-binding protein YihA/YsxC [Longimicrobiaceae bacterium]|nr:ribosome biogenesis GTP-binding protein YihA/YsxC [Longimicrobiaceae bacterium]